MRGNKKRQTQRETSETERSHLEFRVRSPAVSWSPIPCGSVRSSNSRHYSACLIRFVTHCLQNQTLPNTTGKLCSNINRRMICGAERDSRRWHLMFLSFRHVSDPSVSRRDEGETLRKCEGKGGKCHPKTERNEGSNRRTSQAWRMKRMMMIMWRKKELQHRSFTWTDFYAWSSWMTRELVINEGSARELGGWHIRKRLNPYQRTESKNNDTHDEWGRREICKKKAKLGISLGISSGISPGRE